MKIAFVSTYPNQEEKHSSSTGGVASYTKNLVTSIPTKDNDQIYVIANRNQDETVYSEGDVRVIRVWQKSALFILSIYRQLRILRPDAIHVQQELNLYGNVLNAYLLQWLLFLLKNKNVTLTLHGVVSLKAIDNNFIRGNNSKLPVWLTKLAFRIIYKPLCAYAKHIVVHEDYFKKILVKEYSVPSNKIEVIYHGVENFTTIDMRTARKALQIGADKKVILFIGYLTGYKGLDLLIDGFGKFAKNNPNAMLLIGAGKHPKLQNNIKYLKGEYYRLEEKAAKLIPSKQYKWVGFIEEKDITTYFSAADVAVYPYTVAMSSSGPMSMSIGYGKPFLASDAFSEIFSLNILFPRNEEELSKKFTDFFKNSGEYKKIIKNMRHDRLWSEVGKVTYNLYEK